MDGTLSLVTAPRAEPISLEEAKLHLRVDGTDDDAYIEGLVRAARRYVERITGRTLVLTTWDYALDSFPRGGRWFWVPRAPLRSLDSITYHDEDLSTSTVWPSSNYQVDTLPQPAKVALKKGVAWPSATLRESSGVVVRFRAGYEAPFTVDNATDTMTALDHWFSNGDVVRVRVSSDGTGALPTGLEEHTDYYVIGVSGDDFQLSATEGGSAISVSDNGSGSLFVGPEVTPEPVRQYMLLMVGTMYASREHEISGTITTKMKFADNLLERLHWF